MIIDAEIQEVYIGVKKCSCVQAIMLKGLNKIDEENTLDEWQDRGLKIELTNLKDAKDRLKVCKCKINKKQNLVQELRRRNPYKDEGYTGLAKAKMGYDKAHFCFC